MFEKKTVIFSETIGVCVVDDITKLSSNKQDFYSYYELRSLMDKKKVSYIPVDKHDVVLRELVGFEEAIRIKKEEYKELDPLQKFEVDYVIDNNKED